VSLNISSPKAARLWCNNIGTKYLSANPIFHGRSKHIEVDYHDKRGFHKLLNIDFVSSKDHIAYGFTKALSVRLLENFKNNLNLVTG
jgi:hypothetical protein